MYRVFKEQVRILLTPMLIGTPCMKMFFFELLNVPRSECLRLFNIGHYCGRPCEPYQTKLNYCRDGWNSQFRWGKCKQLHF